MANNIRGYGFWELADVYERRLNEVDGPIIRTAIEDTLRVHNEEVNTLLARLCVRITIFKEQYALRVAGTLQPLDARGVPLPVRTGGKYDVAYPIWGAGTAWGNNRISRALMTVRDLDEITEDFQFMDLDWLKRHILGAWLTKDSWTYQNDFDELKPGALTIAALANGDSTVFQFKNGTSGTDNHYLAQAADISDAANPFPLIKAALTHHGSNTGANVAYIPANLVSDVTSLTTFVGVKDPDLSYGADVTTLNDGNPALFGELLGKVDGVWVSQWDTLPDDYIAWHAAGVTDVFAMREYPAAEVQGFFPEFNDVNGNYQENRFLRFAGFAPRNRVAAGATLIGSASYSTPAGFALPMAV